jgi:hypothetical protein
MIKLGQIYNDIAKAEGKKHQASVGDVREVCGLFLRKLRRLVRDGQGADVAALLRLLHKNKGTNP